MSHFLPLETAKAKNKKPADFLWRMPAEAKLEVFNISTKGTKNKRHRKNSMK